MKWDIGWFVSFFGFFFFSQILHLVSSQSRTCLFALQPDLSASASPLPPADLSLAPPADTPEAAFDLIAASNLQPAAALQLNSTPDPDSEEPAEPEDGPDSELDTNMVEEKQEEEDEIPLNEVQFDENYS